MRRGALLGWLRDLDPDELTEILRRRPDATPPPADLDELAARLSDRPAVTSVLATLPLPALQLLKALGDGPKPLDQLAHDLGRDPEDPEISAVLQVLTQRALAYPTADGLAPIFSYNSDAIDDGAFEPVPPAPRLIPADRLQIVRTAATRPVLQLVNWWSGPPLRQVVIRVLHTLPPDTAAAGDSLPPLARWTAPLVTHRDLSGYVGKVLTEAVELGICAEPQPGYFAIAPLGRALADGRPLVAAQRLRVRPVGSVVVSEDPDLLDEVAAALELERLAPTVAGAPTPPAETIAALKAAGYSPEAAEGKVTLRRRARPSELAEHLAVPHQRDAPPQRTTTTRPDTPPQRGNAPRHLDIPRLDTPALDAPALEQIRRQAPQLSAAHARLLAEAVDQRTPVWIRYIDSAGKATGRVIVPAQLNGPTLEAYCRLRSDDRAFTLERIVAVAAVEG